MSFIGVPTRVSSALTILKEAINERATTAGSTHVYISTPPFYRDYLAGDMKQMRDAIIELYRRAFPPENFGKFGWTDMLQQSSDPLEDRDPSDAIAQDLRANGIDPNFFLMIPPRKLRDRQFILACYHLLNNRTLYFFPHGRNLHHSYGRSKEIKYRSNGSIYSTEEFDFEDRPEFDCDLATGTRNAELNRMSYDLETHYVFHYGTLRGSWQVRFHAAMGETYITDNDFVNKGNSIQHVVDFNGLESVDVLTTFTPEVKEKAEFYRNWGHDYKTVGLSVTSASGGLYNYEAKVTKDNFPPLTYKYYDPGY